MKAAVAVIFDMDGVLVDSGDAHRRAWQELGRETGTEFSDALFDRTFGQRNESIIPAWLGPVPGARAKELGDRKEVLYRRLVGQGDVSVYPGTRELVASLHALGVRVGIASSGPKANIDLLVEVLGVRSSLQATVTADDVREGKPHPEVFLRAAERLRVPPARCAVIEDSVHGIEAAERAGMFAVGVLTTTDRGRLLAAGAARTVDAVGDLRAEDLARQLEQRS
jgi:beta-phosphoglucomutase